MMQVNNAESVATGYVHALSFSGPAPGWDTIRRIVYEGETHPDLLDAKLFKNRLTDYAVQCAAGMWVDQYTPTPSKIILGTGSPPTGQTDVLSSDTALWTPDNTTNRTVDIKTVFMSVYSEFGVTYQTGEINGIQYKEAGLTDKDGKLWAHVMLNITKNSTQTVVLLWKVYHQGI